MTGNAKLTGLHRLVVGMMVAGTFASVVPLHAQTDDPVVRLVATPTELTMRVGDEVRVTVAGYTRSGARVEDPVVRLVGPRAAVRVRQGVVTALAAGDYALVATLVQDGGAPAGEPVTVRVPVGIGWPTVARVVVSPSTNDRLFVGTTLRMAARAEHADGSARTDPDVAWRSDSPDVVTVDGFGRVTAVAPGTATITATVEGVAGAATLSTAPFTGESL